MKTTFRRKAHIHLQDLITGIQNGDRVSLSRAITLVESKRAEDKNLSIELIEKILPHSGNSLRLGITGVPGVGKSTFIESFGKQLTKKGLMVAVLSVDPSSSRTRGSILGDKTRMEQLSKDPNAYIRPSASGTTLGGVASKTRESILLCEAAGFDVIVVETVGVGQSETMVKDMVDYFMLLMLAGGGDELQGIKRGIMELADHILINKADGDNLPPARRAQKEYKNAIHLFPPHDADWEVPVELCSAAEHSGIEAAWEMIQQYWEKTKRNGFFQANREKQTIKWFHEMIHNRLETEFYNQPNIREIIREKEKQLSSRTLSVRKAVDELFT